MKLTLDHKALIELLDRAGPEFELEIRQGVLETAMRKHIKAVTPEEVTRLLNSEIKTRINEVVASEIGTFNKLKNFELTPKLQKAVDEKIDQVIRIKIEEVATKIKKDVNASIVEMEERQLTHYKTEIERHLVKRINDKISKMINEGVNVRIDEMYAASKKDGDKK